MGNVKTDANGVAKGTLKDSQIKLIGPHSVIGVSLNHAACGLMADVST